MNRVIRDVSKFINIQYCRDKNYAFELERDILVSRFFFESVVYEFVSLDWMINELISLPERIMDPHRE